MFSVRRLFPLAALLSFGLCFCASAAQAESAYVRVSQVGYETGESSARAYLMSTAAETGATFKVVAAGGSTAYAGKVGPLLGTWSNSKKLVYQVYALDFVVPRGRSYSISVSGPVSAQFSRSSQSTVRMSFTLDCWSTRFSSIRRSGTVQTSSPMHCARLRGT